MANTTFEIVKKQSYRAIGLKWDGPWSEIQQLKKSDTDDE